MNKPFIKLDERQTRIVQRISSVMYLLTIYALVGFQLYRQFVLHQQSGEWNDIAILISINIIVWIGSLLYLSGVFSPKLESMRFLAFGFAGFVIVGLAFTFFKYTVLLNQPLSMSLIKEAGSIVLMISAVLLGIWAILAYLGSKRMEKNISETDL